MAIVKALTPVRSSSAVAEAKPSRAIVVSKNAVPPTVQTGIKNLLLAFPAGPAQPADDRVQTLRLYAEACDGFEQSVVEYVLRRLPFHNPRNPFPPTPQDVLELCKETSANWRFRAACYRLEPGFKWGPSRYDHLVKDNGWNKDWGPSPDEPGCYVPEAMIFAGMRQTISRYEKRLVEMSDADFSKVSLEAFPDGYHDAVVAKRQQRAYEAALPSREREAREGVLWDIHSRDERMPPKNPAEVELRRLTQEKLKEWIEDERRGSAKCELGHNATSMATGAA